MPFFRCFIYDAANDTFLNQFFRRLREESSVDAYHRHMIFGNLFFCDVALISNVESEYTRK
jgi:hypothetical protein